MNAQQLKIEHRIHENFDFFFVLKKPKEQFLIQMLVVTINMSYHFLAFSFGSFHKFILHSLQIRGCYEDLSLPSHKTIMIP